MNLVLPANKVPFTLILGVKTFAPEEICVVAKDNRKPYTYYYNRKITVNGIKEFELKMPQTPPILEISIYNKKNGRQPDGADKSFGIVKVEPKPLKENPIWLTPDDKEFIEFAQWFSEEASILSADKIIPHSYRSKNGKFTIDYYDKIYDKEKGYLYTPARIGHITGTIDVSKSDFIKMTVPMRMIVLLHEYCHKYKNPKIKRSMRDEVAADILACRIYLSLGYSELEAHYAYTKIFIGAKSEENYKRYLIIRDFIQKFNAGLFNNVRTDYVAKKAG